MAKIYEEASVKLHELLARASHDQGATLLIPDLQRPYVWTPNQVTLLVDSLIRGWPFGTLLLWKVHHEDLRNIPSRQFWRVLDRTDEGAGTTVSAFTPPGEFQMVLDGQQRVQSLLLSFGGDSWGFKLYDHDWAIETESKSARGRRSKRHWSLGSLCFDLDAFSDEYRRVGDIWEIDFQRVLKWAVVDPSKGQSTAAKPQNYVEPIPQRHSEQCRSTFIRLSRFWSAAPPNSNLKEKDFKDPLRALMREHGVREDSIERLLDPLAELMTTLRDIKLTDVTFLELVGFDPSVWSRDAYDDAIVNIFTRLNTAGRTLTREEITFAWLKVGWSGGSAERASATASFEQLGQVLRDQKLDLSADEQVRAISLIWSVAFNKGRLLSDRDLLRGETIRPMASDLARNWQLLSDVIEQVSTLVNGRGLEFRTHYFSLNAIAILWAWAFIGARAALAIETTVPVRDSFQRSIESLLSRHVDRWLICSQWAQRWAGGSGKVLDRYASELADDDAALAATSDPQLCLTRLENRLKALVKDLEADATGFIDTLEAESRDQVRGYFVPLWVWHRLEKNRWRYSKIALKERASKRSTLQVDHVVAVKLWERKLDGIVQTVVDSEAALSAVNKLGNCLLLEKSFNVSKNDRPLRDFLNQVQAFQTGATDLNAWCTALEIDPRHVDSGGQGWTDLGTQFDFRTEKIRASLRDFVTGNSPRVDVE